MPLFDCIKQTPGGSGAAMYGMLEQVGLGQRRRRPPYHSLTDMQFDALAQSLRGLGFSGGGWAMSGVAALSDFCINSAEVLYGPLAMR